MFDAVSTYLPFLHNLYKAMFIGLSSLTKKLDINFLPFIVINFFDSRKLRIIWCLFVVVTMFCRPNNIFFKEYLYNKIPKTSQQPCDGAHVLARRCPLIYESWMSCLIMEERSCKRIHFESFFFLVLEIEKWEMKMKIMKFRTSFFGLWNVTGIY